MLILITYDVNTEKPEGRKRLRNVAKICVNYGQRVQNSVFECMLDNAKLSYVRNALLKVVNLKEDSLRIYHIGKNYRDRIEHYGVKPSYDPEGLMIV